MKTNHLRRWMLAFFSMTSTYPASASDMGMAIPIFTVPILMVGMAVAIAAWVMARETKVRTGVLMAIYLTGAVLSFIPGLFSAAVSNQYTSSQYADIAIFYLIAFLVYLIVMVSAFIAIARRGEEKEPDSTMSPENGEKGRRARNVTPRKKWR
ncbi:hypothetical protein [uncultured Thiodictyon sp.]|uniref:hypothetical protein n=1 Tax=uncultured Thiodictyon sp. TaxID=1846217 RepID=UPI0025F3D079|nr:hypothetical protein [uncultured Thiodictyon sp.]